MKNKIIKILESPQIVIPVVLIIAFLGGFLVYKNIGVAPRIKINNQDNANPSFSDLNQQNYKDGEQIDLAFPKSGRVDKINVKAGDTVKKGEILASLDSTDAQGALEIAKANYQKVINGATGADIDVAKTAVITAEVNLENVKNQQNLAVKTAYDNLLNSTPEAVPDNGTSDYVAPIISGNYNLNEEGVIKIHLYYSNSGMSFDVSGLTKGNGIINAITAQPIGDSGLYIKFADNKNIDLFDWDIILPNIKASNYLANQDAYQSSLETQNRLVSLAQANLDQADSALILKQTRARPEDVSVAMGTLEIAQGAYDNDFIYAPTDGTVSVVNINPGEIASMNQKIIGVVVKINN